jgi:hypothetical protein
VNQIKSTRNQTALTYSKNNVNVIGEDNQREMNTNDKVFFFKSQRKSNKNQNPSSSQKRIWM